MGTKTREYRYRDGRGRKTPAEVVGKEIEKIRALEGDPSPESLVRHARADNHPLHAEFTWDDSIAGHQWRLQEARELFTSYYIIQSDDVGDALVRIANISIVDEEANPAYADWIDVMDQEAVQARELTSLLGVLTGAVRRFRDVDSCRPIVQSIEKIIRKYRDKQSA
jgi:hypothetical protein